MFRDRRDLGEDVIERKIPQVHQVDRRIALRDVPADFVADVAVVVEGVIDDIHVPGIRAKGEGEVDRSVNRAATLQTGDAIARVDRTRRREDGRHNRRIAKQLAVLSGEMERPASDNDHYVDGPARVLVTEVISEKPRLFCTREPTGLDTLLVEIDRRRLAGAQCLGECGVEPRSKQRPRHSFLVEEEDALHPRWFSRRERTGNGQEEARDASQQPRMDTDSRDAANLRRTHHGLCTHVR